MKRFESGLENRRMYKFDNQYSTDLPTEGSLRSLKALGGGYKGSNDIMECNDHLKKVEPTFYNQNLDSRYFGENRKNEKQITEGSDYKSLHQKLNILESKLLKMKTNIEKKREDKKQFLESQQRERYERERRREQTKSKQKNQNSLKKLVTQVQPAAFKGMVTQVPQHKDLKYFEFNPYSPRSNIYYVSEITKAYKQERSLAREHLISSMQLLKQLEVSRKNAPEMRSLNLTRYPGYKDKKTIIFDLDETLIHCNQNLSLPYDVKLPVKFPTGELVEAGINVRPYAKELLRNLASKFQIIVFTASHSCYANVVLDYLDPEGNLIKHRLYREHCYQSPENMYVKDLRIINRPLSDMVLVDNAAYSYAYQVDNAIPILPFYDAKNDFQLVALQKYLQGLLLAKDVRDVNRKTFKLHLYNMYDDVGKLVHDLYLDNR